MNDSLLEETLAAQFDLLFHPKRNEIFQFVLDWKTDDDKIGDIQEMYRDLAKMIA